MLLNLSGPCNQGICVCHLPVREPSILLKCELKVANCKARSAVYLYGLLIRYGYRLEKVLHNYTRRK